MPKRILIVSAPSGAGKTSLTRALVAKRDDAGLAVSHTTRERRPNETHGVHYYFVSRAAFEKRIRDNGFIEYAKVFDHYYGTSRDEIAKLRAADKHVVLDIDWQGARRVRREFPDACSVFVVPPSLDALEQRLRQRQRDSEEVIARRMQSARSELSHKDEYHHELINDDFELALARLEDILLRGPCENPPTKAKSAGRMAPLA